MGIKQLYNDNLRKLPNEYGDISVMRSKTTEVEPETTFLYQSKAITLLFINKFSLFRIPNHFSPIPMSMQSLKKIGPKLLNLESRNEALTDGRTDKRKDR